MSIEITSNSDAKVPTQSVSDKAPATEPAKVDASSAKAQGETEALEGAQTPSESENSSETNTQTQDAPKKKSGIQRLKERHAREMAEIRQEIANLRTQAPSGKRLDEASQSVVENEEPKEEAYESHADYVRALAKWTYAEEKAKDQQKSKEAQVVDEYKSRIDAHKARVAEFRKSTPEFVQVVNDFIEEHGDMSFSPGLEESILESDVGPQIILELAKRPDELNRINRLSVVAASREVGKIEERINARKSVSPETKTTKAPPPPNPLSGKPDSGSKSIYSSELSQEEYEALRRKQMKASRGA